MANSGQFKPGNKYGGPRPGSGRKSKAEELGLTGLLDEAFPHADRVELWRKLVTLALGGDLRAIELLAAYTWGKPRQAVELTGADGGAIELNVYADHFDASIAAKLASATAPDVSGESDD
jgi:hypothetical protein